jgi:hypothetical protein
MKISEIIDLGKYPVEQREGFGTRCKRQLDQKGSLLLPGFITDQAVEALKAEALEHAHLAYFCQQTHTAYLSAPDPQYDSSHPGNRQVKSSKGCITDDQIPLESPLRTLYDNESFQAFLCHVLDEDRLYRYADPLSSLNVNYFREGQELGWHFDNSPFSVTLMIQAPEQGGEFEYIPRLRNYESGDMNFDRVGAALDGKADTLKLELSAGTLALFRGRNSLHRVTPVSGETDRIQVVLAYSSEPGIALTEQARLTFYGRIQ